MGRLKKVLMIVGGCAIIVGGVASCFNPASLGRTPTGERLERVKRSPNYRDGQFQNREERPQMTTKKGFFGVMYDQIFVKYPNKVPKEPVHAVKSDVRNLPEQSFVWFGHSSYLIRLGGKNILVDPVFYVASPVTFYGKPFKGTDIYKPVDMPEVIDYLVISHDHYDHLDFKTVRELEPRVRKVVCGLGVGKHFEKWGFPAEKLIELDWDDQYTPGDDGWRITCTPAHHFSGRFFNRNQSLWASYVIESPNYSVYIGGDSGYNGSLKEVGTTFPDLDLAIIENGQYSENWRYIHNMPDDLIKVVRDLDARNVLTVHHSKFSLSQHPWDEPLKNEKDLVGKTNSNIIITDIGVIVHLK